MSFYIFLIVVCFHHAKVDYPQELLLDDGPLVPQGGSASSPQQFPLRSLNELLQAPARWNQPTLHPYKKDCALWYYVKFIILFNYHFN